VCRAQPNTVYAFVDCYETIEDSSGSDAYGRQRTAAIKGAQIYRSDDGGVTWKMTSENNRAMQRSSGTYGWVFGQVRADPVDPDTVYFQHTASDDPILLEKVDTLVLAMGHQSDTQLESALKSYAG